MTRGEAEGARPVLPRTISSAQTFFTKFVLPGLWIPIFGGVVVAAWLGLLPPEMKVAGLLAWLVGATIMWRTCARLKRVRLGDGALYISNYSIEIRVPVSEIEEVTENRWINIHPVTIRFRNETEFGSRITFMPKVRMFGLWRSHPIVAELRELAHHDTNGRIVGAGGP